MRAKFWRHFQMRERISRPLTGRAILVTRPVEQAHGLARLIEQAGGSPVLFPTIEIGPPSDVAAATALLRDAASFDLLIFVSPTAVDRAVSLAHQCIGQAGALAAVGRATARRLTEQGGAQIITPAEGNDSEALLSLPQLHAVRAQRVLIVRGEGGRELLKETLEERGASVSYAECYRRVLPLTDPAELIERWQAHGLDAVTAMSSASLQNLHALLAGKGADLLRQTPLFVSHRNIADCAHRLGLHETAITGADDEGMLRGLCAWFSLQPKHAQTG